MSSILAFDTATEHMSIAVCVGERVWTHEGAGGAQASATLIPQVQRLLADAGATLADLDAIGFGQGPGAFTGLRTACSVAQGLAFGASKPVLGLDTLMVVAEDAASSGAGDDVWVVMDARMNEIYAGHYVRQDGEWTTRQAPALFTLEAMNRALEQQEPRAVAGTGVAAFAEQLAIGSAARFAQALPRAAALMAVARSAWKAGRAVDAADALPVYVRDKVAMTTAEREAAKAEKAEKAARVAS